VVERVSRPGDARRSLATHPGRRARARLAAVACLAALACSSTAPPPAPVALPGSVRGRMLARPEAREAMLVFLEALEAPPGGGPAAAPALLRSTDRGLEPPVLAARSGQPLRFENAARIYHQLFSYSESNPFDLGVLRRGEQRSLQLRGPGVVRIYCKLHPAESALLFVAPSEHFTVAEAGRAWAIVGVPPGRYRVAAWGETSAGQSRDVTIAPGATVRTEIAARPRAAMP